MFVFNCNGVDEFKRDLRLFNKAQGVEDWPADAVREFFCSQFSWKNGQSISFSEEAAAFSAAQFNGKELISLEIKQLLSTCSLLNQKDRMIRFQEVIEILRKCSSSNTAEEPCLNPSPSVPQVEAPSNRSQRSRSTQLRARLPIKSLGGMAKHKNGNSESRPIVNCSDQNILKAFFLHDWNSIPIKEWTDKEAQEFFSRKFCVNESYYIFHLSKFTLFDLRSMKPDEFIIRFLPGMQPQADKDVLIKIILWLQDLIKNERGDLDRQEQEVSKPLQSEVKIPLPTLQAIIPNPVNKSILPVISVEVPLEVASHQNMSAKKRVAEKDQRPKRPRQTTQTALNHVTSGVVHPLEKQNIASIPMPGNVLCNTQEELFLPFLASHETKIHLEDELWSRLIPLGVQPGMNSSQEGVLDSLDYFRNILEEEVVFPELEVPFISIPEMIGKDQTHNQEEFVDLGSSTLLPIPSLTQEDQTDTTLFGRLKCFELRFANIQDVKTKLAEINRMFPVSRWNDSHLYDFLTFSFKPAGQDAFFDADKLMRICDQLKNSMVKNKIGVDLFKIIEIGNLFSVCFKMPFIDSIEKEIAAQMLIELKKHMKGL